MTCENHGILASTEELGKMHSNHGISLLSMLHITPIHKIGIDAKCAAVDVFHMTCENHGILASTEELGKMHSNHGISLLSMLHITPIHKIGIDAKCAAFV